MNRICTHTIEGQQEYNRGRIWILFMFLVLLQFSLSAQYQVSTCEELGLRPIEPGTGNDILKIYLETDKFPTRGCWVHHHPNGRDYVVTPDNWGEFPVGENKQMIEDAMHAISDARKKYEQYGSMDNQLYYILDDVIRGGRAGEAFWVIGSECWMQSGVPMLWGESINNKQVFAHEIGHCFVMENVPDLRTNYRLNNWFDESVSEYLSSEVYPTNNLEFRFSSNFDLDSIPFKQKYKAYPLWYYFVQKRGKSLVVPMMKYLAVLATREERLSYMRSSNFDRLYHDFLFDYYTRSLEDSGGGLIPIETRIKRRQDKIQLIPEAMTPMMLDTIPSERLSIYQVIIPPSHDVTIHPPRTTNKIHFSILNNPDKIKNWNEPVLIEGYCDREREFRLLVSHLNTSEQRDIPIRYELDERVSCCTLTTAITDNPSPEELDGQFHFDYYIESEVEMMADGTTQTMPMNYFVNSRDGSMLLLRSFFMDNFGSFEDDGMKADAVIWLANGQIVAYVQDKDFGQKRAITIDVNQTRADVMGPRAINPEELLREGRNSGLSPAALPSDSPWSGQASAYTYYREERFDPGIRNLMTSYVSNDISVVASPMSSFGFMVGHIKDLTGQNKHLVYTRYETPNGDIMRAKLHKLEKECASFNGAGYKKMTLGGFSGAIGSMSESEREVFADQQMAYNEQLLALLADMERCGDNENCKARVTRQMMDLEKRKKDELYDLPEPGEFSGDAGSDFQDEERQIRVRLYAKQDEILDKDIHCKRLSRQNSNCGGCMNMAVERCQGELQRMEQELDQLECEMAKLHGAGDMLEDCH